MLLEIVVIKIISIRFRLVEMALDDSSVQLILVKIVVVEFINVQLR